jgi:hypothetical protein
MKCIERGQFTRNTKTMNLETTATEACINDAMDALYNTEDIGLLSDQDGEDAVAAALASCGNFSTVCDGEYIAPAETFLEKLIKDFWQIVKQVQQKIKTWTQYVIDDLFTLKAKTFVFNQSSGGGGGS